MSSGDLLETQILDESETIGEEYSNICSNASLDDSDAFLSLRVIHFMDLYSDAVKKIPKKLIHNPRVMWVLDIYPPYKRYCMHIVNFHKLGIIQQAGTVLLLSPRSSYSLHLLVL